MYCSLSIGFFYARIFPLPISISIAFWVEKYANINEDRRTWELHRCAAVNCSLPKTFCHLFPPSWLLLPLSNLFSYNCAKFMANSCSNFNVWKWELYWYIDMHILLTVAIAICSLIVQLYDSVIQSTRERDRDGEK